LRSAAPLPIERRQPREGASAAELLASGQENLIAFVVMIDGRRKLIIVNAEQRE